MLLPDWARAARGREGRTKAPPVSQLAARRNQMQFRARAVPFAPREIKCKKTGSRWYQEAVCVQLI
eukprot:838127-Rhodomonas_salina.1